MEWLPAHPGDKCPPFGGMRRPSAAEDMLAAAQRAAAAISRPFLHIVHTRTQLTYTTAVGLQEALACGEITPDAYDDDIAHFRVVCGAAVSNPPSQLPPSGTKSGSSGSKATSAGRGSVKKEPVDEIGLALVWAWPTKEGTNKLYPIVELKKDTLLHQHAGCVDALYVYAHHLASGKPRTYTKTEEGDLVLKFHK
jgi:hypothetical protein